MKKVGQGLDNIVRHNVSTHVGQHAQQQQALNLSMACREGEERFTHTTAGWQRLQVPTSSSDVTWYCVGRSDCS